MASTIYHVQLVMVVMYMCTHKTVWLREGFDNQIRNCRLLSKKLRKEKRCGFVNTLKFEKQAMSIICPGLPYQEAVERVNIVPIVYFITGLCSYTFDTIIKVPRHRLHSLIPFSGPSRYVQRCNKHFILPKCKTYRFRNNFTIRSCINNIYTWIFSRFLIYFVVCILFYILLYLLYLVL